MASNKTTTNPCFGTDIEAALWCKRNCQQCARQTVYNERLKRMPKRYNCAIQRDIDLQQSGEMEISERSYRATLDRHCEFFKSNKPVGDDEKVHISPNKFAQGKSLISQEQRKVVDIVKEAEKVRAERIAKAEKAEKDKATDIALAKAFDRRMQRSTIAAKSKPVITPEVERMFKEKSDRMKARLDDIVRVHLSSYHIIVSGMLDIGDGVMQDCIREIKKRGLYRHELKRQINKALEAYHTIDARLRMVTREVKELREIVLDNLNDLVENDIPKLTYSLKFILDKHHIKDSMFIAQIDTAWCMFELARQQAEFLKTTSKNMCLEVFRKENIPVPSSFYPELEGFFTGKKPDGIAKEWQRVSDMIQPSQRAISDELSEDANVKLAIDIINRKLSNVQAIETMSNDIIEENPSVVAKYLERHPECREPVAI